MRRSGGFFPVRRERDWDLEPGFGSLASFSASPWQMMRRMQEDMDRMFGQLLQPMASGVPGQQMQQWVPSVDVSQDQNEWLIEADLPGVNKDDVEVHVHDHHLILRAEMRSGDEGERGSTGDGQAQRQGQNPRQYHQRERRYGFLERVIPLPQSVDEEAIRCEFRDGVLKVHVPKSRELQNQPRRIPIGEGGQAGTAGARATGAMQSGTTGAAGSQMAAGPSRGTNGRTNEAAMAGAKGGATGEAETPKRPRRKKTDTPAAE